MVKIKFAAFAAVILAAVAMSVLAQQPQATQAGIAGALPDGKIVVINTTVFPDQINELKQKYGQLDNQFKDRYQKLQSAETQLKAMENDLRTKQNVLAPDKYAELQVNYEESKKRLQRDAEDAKSDYDRATETTTKPVRDKLYQFLQNYASSRGIVLIINLAGAAQTGSLAYWSPGADITDDFIAEYNKANPVPGVAPAGAAKPAGKP
jgi:outer membrane protein